MCPVESDVPVSEMSDAKSPAHLPDAAADFAHTQRVVHRADGIVDRAVSCVQMPQLWRRLVFDVGEFRAQII